MATTTIASSSAAAHGGVRVFGRTWRRGADAAALALLLLIALIGLMLGYARAAEVVVGIAGPNDVRSLHYRQHLLNFHDPEVVAGESLPSYRWTQERSTISVPGVGRGLWDTQLTLSSPIPAEQPKQALISSGDTAWRVQLQNQRRTYHLLTPSDGDLRVSIESAAERYGADPRLLGVVFSSMQLTPVITAAFPPALFLLHTLLALVIAFVTLRLIGVPTWLALGVPVVGTALLSWGLAINRAPTGLYSYRLLAIALVGLLLLAALRWAIPRVFRAGGVEIGPTALTALLAVVYVSYLVRAVGLLWPYFLAIDIEWHMEKTRRVLNGRIMELWDANSPFHQSVMPTDEWGADKPLIPYSPFYHIFSVIWAIFPWPLELSANIFSVVIDALRSVLIFFLARKWGFRDRAGIIGAATYSIIPASFLMHSWGNTPTTNGMWWSLLAMAVLVGTWERLHKFRAAWIVLTLVLTATMLFYAVTAVFMTLVMFGVVGWLLIAGRRRETWPIFASTVAALALSIAIYYWQFVPGIIERTLPKLFGAATGGTITGGAQPSVIAGTWWGYVGSYAYFLDIYGMYLPLLLGLVGWWIGARKLGWRSSFAAVMTMWLLVALLFWVIGYKIVMVDKQLFWLMPWMGLATGIAVDRILDNRRALRWAVPLLALGALYVGSDALYLWVHRLQGWRGEWAFTSWVQLLRGWL